MTKRLPVPADEALLDEVDALLGPGLKRPSRTKLEYWRHWQYIPSERDGRGPGSSLSYPAGTAQQVVALVGELQDKRDLDRAALRLFFAPEGYWVGAKALRPAVLGELNGIRNYMERRRGPGGARRTAAPCPSDGRPPCRKGRAWSSLKTDKIPARRHAGASRKAEFSV